MALIVRRQAGGWGSAPLANEDEYHLRHWLARFDKPKALKEERFRANISLIELANASPATLLHPDFAPTERSYLPELKRCLAGDLDRPGPWMLDVLDRLCHEVLEEAEPVTPNDATASAADNRNPDQEPDPPPKKTRDEFLYGLKEQGIIPGRAGNITWPTAEKRAKTECHPGTSGISASRLRSRWKELEL